MKKNVSKKDVNNLKVLEEAVRNQTQRKKIETAILGSISLAGFLSAALIAPNAVRVLRKAIPDLRPVNQKQSVRNAINRVIKSGHIEKRGDRYYITERGRKQLELLKLRSYTKTASNGRKKWDKKWRVVIFDIPERQRSKRNKLRSTLIETGFVKVQNSVWVYPFQCDEVVALLKFELRLGRSAVYMIVDAIEGDEWLREHFKLPPAS